MKNIVLRKISSLMLLGFLGNQVLASDEVTIDAKIICSYIVKYGGNDLEDCLSKLPKTEINNQDEKGRTYLHLAAKNSTFDNVKLLIESGIDCHLTSKDGSTPFHSAVSRIHDNDKSREDGAKIIKALIDQGVDVNAKDDSGATALHIAVEKDYKKAVEALLEVKDINKSLVTVADTFFYQKVTPSHIAILNGRPDILELLMQNNVERQFVEDGDGYTILAILEDMKHIHEETFTIDDLRAEDANRSLAYMDRHNKDKEKMKQFAKIFDDYCSYAKPADL